MNSSNINPVNPSLDDDKAPPHTENIPMIGDIFAFVRQNMRYLAPLFLFILVLMTYSNAMTAELLYSWDDNRYIKENYLIHDLSPQAVVDIFSEFYFAAYIPVTLLSYAIEYALWEQSPDGYHITNVILHGLNTLLVFWVVLRIQGERSVAILAAILFAIHPIQVENIAWISQRKSLLSLFFFLLCVLTHTSAEKGRYTALNRVLAYALFILSVLSKPTVVFAPILLMFYDYFWTNQKPLKILLLSVPYWITGVIGSILIVQAHDAYGGLRDPINNSLGDHIGVMLWVVWDYVEAFFAPFNLNNFYLYNPAEVSFGNIQIWLGLLVLVILAVLALWQPLGKPQTMFAILWIVVMMLPVANIIPIAVQRADRYIYFPSAMICMLIAIAANQIWRNLSLPEWRYGLSTGGGVILGILLVLTIQRNDVWTNSDTLWADHLTDYPTSETGILNHGVYFFNERDWDTAGRLFTELVRYYPNHFKGNRFMGIISLDRGDYPEAIEFFRRATMVNNTSQTRSEFARLLGSVGDDEFTAGNYAQASQLYETALIYESSPQTITLLLRNIGDSQIELGNLDRALSAYEQALELAPQDPDVQLGMGKVLIDMGVMHYNEGNYQQALVTYQRALEYIPQEPVVFNNIGYTHYTLQDYPAAIDAYQRALALNPNYIRAWLNLGNAYLEIGNTSEALTAFQNVVALDPSNMAAQEAINSLSEN